MESKNKASIATLLQRIGFVYINVELPDPIKVGTQVKVSIVRLNDLKFEPGQGEEIGEFVKAYGSQMEELEINQGKTDPNQWALPFRYLIEEELTIDTAPRLSTALTMVSRLRGLDFEESLAFMVQGLLIATESLFVDKDDSPFTLGIHPEDVTEKLISGDDPGEVFKGLVKPFTSVKSWLDDWDMFSTHLIDNYFANHPADKPGRFYFDFFPPLFISEEYYDQVFGPMHKSMKVTLSLELQAAKLIKQFAEISPGLKNALDGAAKYAPPKKVEDDILKLSVDGRVVIWKGEPYPLTFNQSLVFEILYRDYCKGGKGLSQFYIIDRAGLPDSIMRNIFKDSPLWQTLIAQIKGSRDIYCLNPEG